MDNEVVYEVSTQKVLNDLLTLVTRLRMNQKNYFRNGDKMSLRSAKEKEKELDAMIIKIVRDNPGRFYEPESFIKSGHFKV